MNRNSRLREPVTTIQTVCVGGVYIVDKRIGYDRRDNKHKYQERYDRRLSNWAKSYNRRSRLIDIII
jgi:hypothetical protein